MARNPVIAATMAVERLDAASFSADIDRATLRPHYVVNVPSKAIVRCRRSKSDHTVSAAEGAGNVVAGHSRSITSLGGVCVSGSDRDAFSLCPHTSPEPTPL